MAWRYFEAGRIDDVPAAAARALALDDAGEKYHAEMHLVRGMAYAKRGDLARAEPDLRRAVELDPSSANAWASLAQAQRRLGQQEQSQESQRRARALAPHPSEPIRAVTPARPLGTRAPPGRITKLSPRPAQW